MMCEKLASLASTALKENRNKQKYPTNHQDTAHPLSCGVIVLASCRTLTNFPLTKSTELSKCGHINETSMQHKLETFQRHATQTVSYL